jgi:hypothetical protein
MPPGNRFQILFTVLGEVISTGILGHLLIILETHDKRQRFNHPFDDGAKRRKRATNYRKAWKKYSIADAVRVMSYNL